jgi:hypothetical protein
MIDTHRARGARASALSIALTLVTLVIHGCGAKSGLTVPEPPRFDAAIDAPTPPRADASTFVPPDECIELPPREPPDEITVSFVTRISEADIFFLVDVTGSMMQEIDQIRARLSDTIAPGIARSIPDVRFSLAQYAEFPQPPYGDFSDLPFEMLTPSTSDLATLQRGLDALVLRSGGDGPESAIEALYLAATGESLGVIVPGRRCPADTIGYPCFPPHGLAHLPLDHRRAEPQRALRRVSLRRRRRAAPAPVRGDDHRAQPHRREGARPLQRPRRGERPRARRGDRAPHGRRHGGGHARRVRHRHRRRGPGRGRRRGGPHARRRGADRHHDPQPYSLARAMVRRDADRIRGVGPRRDAFGGLHAASLQRVGIPSR